MCERVLLRKIALTSRGYQPNLKNWMEQPVEQVEVEQVVEAVWPVDEYPVLLLLCPALHPLRRNRNRAIFC